jgi:hypothetical protein
MKLNIGDKVEWYSAAGHLNGSIKNIVLSENGRYETVPWIDIEVINKFGRAYTVRLCASHGNLIMMQVNKLVA